MNRMPAKHKLLIYAALAVVTFAAFEQVRHSDFVYYDDSQYVTENPHVNKGISIESLIWAFTSCRDMGHWHPLTWLSHILDCELFGLNPAGHHIISLLLHIANTLLLFWIFNRMTSALWQSAFVAAVFALHPLHVESVAWVSERKDVLSGFFWMLTTAAYLYYVEKPVLRRNVPVVLFFCLGLMAKSMLVTLPFVLLLLDYWPLGRISNIKNKISKIRNAINLILEKVPLFVLSAASSIVAFIAQSSSGTVVPLETSGLMSRVASVPVSYVSYIIKTFYPAGLAVLYPRQDLPLWQPIVSLLMLAGISAVIFFMRRSRPYLIMGWLWYLGALVPVIGLVQTGAQATADRYTYLPSIGISIMIAWLAPDLLSGLRHRKIILIVSAATAIAAMLICTRIQVKHWRNSVALFEHTLDVTTNNYIIRNNLGVVLSQHGRFDEAVDNYRKVIQTRQDYAEAYYNLGIALQEQSKIDEAVDNYHRALQLKPDYAQAYYNLGVVLSGQGRLADAFDNFEHALEFKADYVQAHNNLAAILLARGKLDEAIGHYRNALEIAPDSAHIHYNLGMALLQQGKLDEAVGCYRRALSLAGEQANEQLANQIRKQLESCEAALKADIRQ